MAGCFFSDGLNFSCKQCSHCCRHEPGYVYLSKKDLTKFCSWFNLDIREFCNKFCRWVDYYDGNEVLCLQEKPNYDCIFWNQGCTAYEARPVQCRTYPFWSFLLTDEKTWNEEAKSCPGINQGTLHSKEEILQAESKYRENRPLSRKDYDKMLGEL